MKTITCETVRTELLDYVERELDDTRRAALDEHLVTCPKCVEELQEIERLRGALAAEPVPDPGAAFWDKFPDQVWQAYRAERSTALRSSLGARAWDMMISRIRSAAAPTGWLSATAAAALIVGLVSFYVIEPSSVPGIAAFQAKIRGGPEILFAKRGVLDLPADHQFGFAASPGTTGFFRIGHEYAQSLVFAAGGDAETARGHLAAIAESLSAAPDALTSLVQGKPSRSQIAALEPELRQIAIRAGTREATLFRAGGWLANLALAVAARDEAAIKVAAAEILPLQHDLDRGNTVPPGALRDLGTLAGLLAGNNLNERDYSRAAGLIRDIQLLLL